MQPTVADRHTHDALLRVRRRHERLALAAATHAATPALTTRAPSLAATRTAPLAAPTGTRMPRRSLYRAIASLPAT